MALTHGKITKAYRPEGMAIAERLIAGQAINAGTTTVVDNSHNSRSTQHSEPRLMRCKELAYVLYMRRVRPQKAIISTSPADVVRLRDAYSSVSGMITVRMMDSWPTLEGWTFASEHGINVSSGVGGGLLSHNNY